MKRKLIIYVVTGVCVVHVILIYRLVTPPAQWKEIKIGDTGLEVRMKCPEVLQDLHDMKGDFCYSDRLLGGWSLQVVYGPDDRVIKKWFNLHIGTQHHFKTIHFEDYGT